MKKILPKLTASFILVIFLLPFVTLAQDNAPSLIVCNGPDCKFEHVIQLAQAIMRFLIYISTFIASALFIYAGILYTIAGDDSSKVSKAKDIFKNVAWGYIIMLSAWVIVYTLVKGLTNNDTYLKFLK